MQSKDLEILNKLKNGDESAFRELFDIYYMPLSLYSLKFSDSFASAEDIVQELFIKIWNEKLYLKFNDAIGPYLFKSVKNNTLQVLKKKSKFRFVKIEDHINQALGEDHIDLSDLEQKKIKLYLEIEKLPEKSKEVFKAIVLGNMKYKEVAEHLDISLNTVKTQYSRALKKLRGSLDIIIMILLA